MTTTVLFGPPGTGKTRELAIIAGRQKGPVLFMSYTKAAALEAAGRVGPAVECSTIHSLAFRLLGLSRQSVVTPKKLIEFSAATGIPFKGADGSEEQEEGDEYLSVLSYARNRLMSDGDAWDRFGRPGNHSRFRSCVDAYEDWKETYGYLDFDDMLANASKLTFPPCPSVILDEAQDCTPLQWLAFEKAAAGAKAVFIAGDDDQAIYEWNGADPHGMVAFMEAHRGTSRVLSKSWRVPGAIHKFVHRKVLREVSKRHEKVFDAAGRDGHIERWGDFEQVPMNVISRPKPNGAPNEVSTLILCRDNYRLRDLQKGLNDKHLPYGLGTANGPYENRFAKAIRGWLRDGDPLPEEVEALQQLTLGDAPRLVSDKDWKTLRARDWRGGLNIPLHMLEFYENVDLFQPIRIELSTIHQAKGREADVVLLDLAITSRVEQGIDLDRDAELRVMYVGLTRARHELHLIGENALI